MHLSNTSLYNSDCKPEVVNGEDVQVPIRQPVDVTATIGLNSPSDLYDLVIIFFFIFN